MNILPLLTIPLVACLLIAGSGCATTDTGFGPTNFQAGGGANMNTGIISPTPNQVFPAGKDIPVQAVANDLSGVTQVTFLLNGKQFAKDTQPPYSAVIAKPAPGKYSIQSYASNNFGDNKLSSPVFITVK